MRGTRGARTLDLAVSDVAAAVRFYERAFAPESVLETPSGAVELWLVADGGLALRVVDERAHAPTMRDRDLYRKGETPRLEVLADDVAARVALFREAGATVRSQEADRAEVVDPFGHLWVIAAPEPEEGPEPWLGPLTAA